MKGKHWFAVALTGLILITVLKTGYSAQKKPAEENAATMEKFVGLMKGYLHLSKQWTEMTSNKEAVLFLAAEGIVEIYGGKSKKEDAIPHLRNILARCKDNRAAGNIIRFKIRDLYKEAGKYDEALKELDAIVEANTP